MLLCCQKVGNHFAISHSSTLRYFLFSFLITCMQIHWWWGLGLAPGGRLQDTIHCILYIAPQLDPAWVLDWGRWSLVHPSPAQLHAHLHHIIYFIWPELNLQIVYLTALPVMPPFLHYCTQYVVVCVEDIMLHPVTSPAAVSTASHSLNCE